MINQHQSTRCFCNAKSILFRMRTIASAHVPGWCNHLTKDRNIRSITFCLFNLIPWFSPIGWYPHWCFVLENEGKHVFLCARLYVWHYFWFVAFWNWIRNLWIYDIMSLMLTNCYGHLIDVARNNHHNNENEKKNSTQHMYKSSFQINHGWRFNLNKCSCPQQSDNTTINKNGSHIFHIKGILNCGWKYAFNMQSQVPLTKDIKWSN